jgi:uncharacterized protein (UPF0262 family)
MFSDEVIAVMARAIQSEVAHPLGSMRLLPETEEELAVAIFNALAEAGFEIVKRDEQPSD